MKELNNFLQIVSEGKRELEIIPEPTQQKKLKKIIPSSSLFENLKSDSFLSILESEMKVAKEQEKKQKKIDEAFEKSFITIFQTKEQEEIIPEKIETEVVEINVQEIEEIVTSITEEIINEEEFFEEPINELLNPATYDKLFKTNVDLFNQPKLPKTDPNIKALTDKLQYVENWLSKISMAGPGGGEVNLRYLDDVDRPSILSGRYLRYNGVSNKFEFAEVNPHDIIYTTTSITSNNYTVIDGDYYLGVDYSGNTTITLPTAPNSGRMLIIKDESGNCSINPITVSGIVDNDIGGFILQMDNGAIQLIYRNGWRII